jgi:bacillithiol biosynthesis cysteine-adding enzyme BshC
VKNTRVDFAKHKLVSPIIADYISGNDFLKPFYKHSPSIDSVSSIIEDKRKEKTDRNLLSDIIREQYSALKKSEAVEANISLLSSEKTFTVTTGHQLNLFTGPLYFIYKILTAVQLAKECAQNFPGYHFIPIYWMASEDHDFEEINHIHLFGEKIEWKQDDIKYFGGASGQLGTEGIDKLIVQLDTKTGTSEHAKKLIDLFRNAYLKHNNLSDATRCVVNELFGSYGLLVLDSNDRRLKNIFSRVMLDDLTHHSAFKLVTETSKQLEEKYEVQVHPREINLFHLSPGKRERITDGNKFPAELETSPENFSPNVVLRPLYQEMILPNVAVVGGPAEIAYWLQYKKIFEHYGVNFPMLVPRKSFLWIDEKSFKLMQQLEIDLESVFLPTDELVNKYIAHVTWKTVSLDEEKKQSELTYDRLSKKITSVDKTLQSSVEAEKKKNLDAINKLEAKLRKAEKNKHETEIQKIKKLKEKLFPEGMLQERYENFIPYYMKYGEGFFDIILKNISAFDFKLNALQEE